MAPKKSAPSEALRLPVKLDAVSNGEFFPRPRPSRIQLVQRLAMERSLENARKKGLSRREYLSSTCGVATVFLTMNQVLGCAGGRYAIENGAGLDDDAAREALTGDEFVFDVQTHRVSTHRPWYEHNDAFKEFVGEDAPQGDCGRDPFTLCFTADDFYREVFLNSDTAIAVLSALPGVGKANPLHIQEAEETRETLARMEGSPRLLLHSIVMPNRSRVDEALDDMNAVAEQYDLAAWKLYPIWEAGDRGYWLSDEETGMRVAERARALGIRTMAVHKGLPLGDHDPTFTRSQDVGPAARANPDLTYLIYHSGYEPEHEEGPYDPDADKGIDVLIRSLAENGIGPDGNVYAELGSTWYEVMGNPDEAAHVLGKLLASLGEDRILWGTDSIWYGSPQDQIQAFRTFEITPEFQERYGYPPLTARAKRKILGLNAARVYGIDPGQVSPVLARDPIGRIKEARGGITPSTVGTYGPRTRREMLAFLRSNGGRPH